MKMVKARWKSDMRLPILPAVALALVLAVPSGAAEKVTWYDRFGLWNGCRPVDVLVVSLSDDAGKIGLRREDIETTVRSRLRGARIHDGVPPHGEPGWVGWMVRHRSYGEPFLYVDISVVSLAFDIEVGFRRSVKVLLTMPEGMDPLVGPATTWRTGSTGTHGRNASYILSSVSQHVDKFIDEYLRVNADACRRISN